MRVFGVDLGVKHIAFEHEGKTYFITFRISIFKGVYDMNVYIDNKMSEIEKVNAYPPLKNIAEEMRRIYIPLYFKRFRHQHNRQHGVKVN